MKLPSMVLRVKRAVRRLAPPPEELAPSGDETTASWNAMIGRITRADRDVERRMRAVERELNRLGLR